MVAAKADQMVAIQLRHDTMSRPLYNTSPFMREYLLTTEEAAALLSQLQAALGL